MNYQSTAIEDLARRLFRPGLHDATPSFNAAMWQEFAAAGLDYSACTGEESELADAVAVLRAAGRGAVALPVAEALATRWIESLAGCDPTERAAALVFSDNASATPLTWPQQLSAMYHLSDDGLRISNLPHPLPEVRENLAGEPECLFEVPALATPPVPLGLSVLELRARFALYRAALMVGAMDEILQICLDHARDRVQFDKPLAQFQAIQQLLAQLAAHSAAAGAAVEIAARDGTVFASAVAKLRANEAVAIITDAAHQITGAMGFTTEFPLERLTRRLWAWRDCNGTEVDWALVIADLALSADDASLWSFLNRAEG